METLAIKALLECPLCYEQLDASAKVLPCQHTFCKACLQKQEAAHSQMFCPECRAPIRVRTVEELPANILLVRLMEDLQGSAGPSRNSRYAVPFARSSGTVRDGHYRELQGHKEAPQVFSRTSMHNQQGDSEGDQILTHINGITPKHRLTVGDDWLHRHISDNSGTSVTAGTPHGANQTLQMLPHHQSLPLCRTLCDFSPKEMNVDSGDLCLTFRKGDILTVIRRVDEHWIEAKLGDRVGICPLQFTELNSVATKLLEGKNPRRSDSAEFQHRTGSRSKDKAPEASVRIANQRVTQVPATTPLTTTLVPSKPHKQPKNSSSNFSRAPAIEENHISGFNLQRRSHRSSVRTPARGHAHPSRVNSQRVRRHSDGPHRLLLLSEKMANETPPNISMALSNLHISSASADSKSSNTQQLSISVCAVLYSYKPQRPEELELRKGEMVGVYGKFKEGWLRGLSLRTGKVGILPSNYITPVLRTSARLLETKAASASSQHNAAAAKKHTTARNPAVVLAPDRPAKSVRFLTDEDPSPPRLRTSSWSSGSQVPSNFAPAPPPLEVWAPSLTLGRDGPGIILKDGKAPTLRKGMETVLSDLNSNPQKTMSSQPSPSTMSAQFSPTRHRVNSTHLAQTDSELSLLQGELVLVHRPRPDGRVLITQETSGQTGLFHSSILHALERLT
ncbi:E3 ubiquitin-protein ligase SH3RF1 isoform X3 [Hippocampus zosterae]|uniref:E3 ubiquitin-protein ligase SH3RF1 isoform X3 n=1 Tax=Hippocampus zosterae TaxID=109293 RepID=UPI00223C9CCE|nr:E3 ubiquitin-protein ligase SH3RF1 isoform X3 [Hippocampus zosterae]